MKKLVIEIRLENEALQTCEQVADIVLRAQTRIRDGEKEGILKDTNGNSVGFFNHKEITR